MSLVKPAGAPNSGSVEFVFEFTENDPNLTPRNIGSASIEFSSPLLKTLQVVKSSRQTSRTPSLDGINTPIPNH